MSVSNRKQTLAKEFTMSSAGELYREMRWAKEQPLRDRREKLIERLNPLSLSTFTFAQLADLQLIANVETPNYQLEPALDRIETFLATAPQRGKKARKK